MFHRVGLKAMVGTAALAGLLLALSVPASATAASQPAQAVLKNVSTGFCLDSNANRNLYTHDCNGGSYQRWSGI